MHCVSKHFAGPNLQIWTHRVAISRSPSSTHWNLEIPAQWRCDLEITRSRTCVLHYFIRSTIGTAKPETTGIRRFPPNGAVICRSRAALPAYFIISYAAKKGPRGNCGNCGNRGSCDDYINNQFKNQPTHETKS